MAGGIELHDCAHDQALFVGIERTHAVGKRFGKHGHGAINEIDGVATQARFAIESAPRSDVMRYIGDVDLQMPATVLAMFHVDRVIEIARGLTIDGDDWQVAEILAARALASDTGSARRSASSHDLRGKGMGKMMLADDDFRVDAKFAGTAQNLDDAAGGSGASARIMKQLNIDDGTIEFRDVGETTIARGLFLGRGEELLAKSGRKFVAGEEFDVVLDARVVGDNDSATRDVAELPDDRGMRAADDADNAALGTSRAGLPAEASDFGDDVIAMHGVFNLVARNEDVAVDVGKGDIGDDESVAIGVVNQAPAYFFARGGLVLSNLLSGRSGRSSGGRRVALGAAKKEAAVSEFLNEAALLEFGEHLKERISVTFSHLKRAGELFDGNRVIPKLKQTQDVICA